MEERRTAAKASSYVIAAAAATAFSYFFFGGSRWSPALWAIFALLAVWIVVMNVRRDAGQKSRASYERWKLQIAFLMVVALLGSGIWHGSLWLFVLGLVLGAVWLGDLRAYRSVYGSSHSGSETDDHD